MCWLLSMQAGKYRRFNDWIEKGLSQVPNDPHVWGLFLQRSHLSDADGRRAIAPGSYPIVYVEDLPGARGQFDTASPNMFSLATDTVQEIEESWALAQRPLTGEATLLHELIHWAWAAAGLREPGRQNGNDIGDLFELDAYGASAMAELRVVTENEDAELGELSRSYESRGRPDAVGHDKNGGWSYGLYQFSSKVGTLAKFLSFLETQPSAGDVYAHYYDRLSQAGGNAAALTGSTAFVTAWRELAGEPAFSQVQHDFVKATHYDRYVANLRPLGIDVTARSRALKEVAWSVSVQHGPGRTSIFSRPWNAMDAERRMKDAPYINAIYDERSNVDLYFASSTPDERKAVLARFDNERARALAMLSPA